MLYNMPKVIQWVTRIWTPVCLTFYYCKIRMHFISNSSNMSLVYQFSDLLDYLLAFSNFNYYIGVNVSCKTIPQFCPCGANGLDKPGPLQIWNFLFSEFSQLYAFLISQVIFPLIFYIKIFICLIQFIIFSLTFDSPAFYFLIST